MSVWTLLCLLEEFVLASHFGRRTVKQTCQGGSQVLHGNWGGGSVARVELFTGNGGEAPALHIASGDVPWVCSNGFDLNSA